MRNLLLLTYTFPPDNTAAAARPGQLFNYLPKFGYQPFVVASSYEGSSGVGPFVHRVPDGREPKATRLASRCARGFMRYFAPYDDRLPWAPYAASTAAGLLRSHGIEAIFSTSPFLAAHFSALWLKAKTGLPWIADFQDPVRDNPFRVRKWFYPYDTIIESLLFRSADRLIANTDTVAAAWKARYPRWSSKTSVLWNSFDATEEIGKSAAPARTHRVLAHIGSLYGERHPGLLLNSLEQLGLSPSSIRVKLVGPIESQLRERTRPLFDRMAHKQMLEYDDRLVDRAEALRETAEADYLLLLDLNEKNASFQLPSKLLDYVRHGKPILAYTPKDSPVERILARSGVDFTAIDPGEPQKVSNQKLASFLEKPPTLKAVAPWFYETFNAETQARTVATLLDDLLTKGK